jgi:hypothetical protein
VCSSDLKINSFLKERGHEKAELEDEKWLFDLAFLTDFTGKLCDMNLELQGKNKCIAEMMSTVSSYKSKFELMMTDLTNNNFDHFPLLTNEQGKSVLSTYVAFTTIIMCRVIFTNIFA